VGFHAAGKIMALHGALKAFAYRGAGDIDDLAGLEHIDFEFAADTARRLRPWPAGIPERYNRRPTFALAKWPARALETRDGRRLPMVT